MSCEATPAHASEPFEWRISQRSRHGSRFSASELRHSKAKPRFCLNAVKRESSGGELLYFINQLFLRRFEDNFHRPEPCRDL